MNIVKYIFGLLLMLSSITGCLNKQKHSLESGETSEKGIEATGFVPTPQVIPEQKVAILPIGTAAPDFNLPGVDGKFYSLEDFEEARALVVIFTCNHCPTAQAYEDRIKGIVKDYQDKSVEVVAISPNSVNALLLEELGYSDMGDSYEEMKIRARDMNYNFIYLYDGDTQESSIKYGPVATPHAFVFNEERILKYTGRLDNSEKPGTANAEELRYAIDAVLSGSEIQEPVTKTFGCSVKWGWKMSWTNKVNQDWENMSVGLTEIDVQGIKDLMKNDTDKLRLINIWATWCGPCIIEYPEFINIHRMYKDRDFEFVSISTDKPENKDKVLKFLRNKNSAVDNYIFSDDDIYKLIDAVDPEWDGALPYTVLLEPGGNNKFSEMGTINPLELKRIIVDHPMIGRYY